MIRYLVRVDCPANPDAVFSFEVEDGVVVEAAPICRWAVGKRGREVVAYWRRRGATVTWWRLA